MLSRKEMMELRIEIQTMDAELWNMQYGMEDDHALPFEMRDQRWDILGDEDLAEFEAKKHEFKVKRYTYQNETRKQSRLN